MIRREIRLSAEDRALLDQIVAERGITRAAWKEMYDLPAYVP